MESLIRDVKFAIRSHIQRPVFIAVTVVTLALGIGGTVTVFSVVDGILIRELPYRDPSSIISVWRAWPSWRGHEVLDYVWDHIHFTAADYINIRASATTLSEVAAVVHGEATFTHAGRTQVITVGRASAGLFELLGVRPAIGRPFHDEEAMPIASRAGRIVLLSHEFWLGRYGRDPSVVGRSITVGDAAHEIVGVLPAGFRMPSDLVTVNDNGGVADQGLRDVWVPLSREAAACGNCVEVVARLGPGRSLDESRSEVQTLLVEGPADQLVRAAFRKQFLTRDLRAPLMAAFGSAVVLLMIACLNVAGMLLAHAADRRREIAVRYALGASGRRVIWQLMTESMVIGLAGVVAGIALAWLGTKSLVAVAPPMARLDAVRVDGRIMTFAVLVGMATSLAFGALPAASLAGGRHTAVRLRVGSRGSEGRSVHSAIVAVQVGLTVVILVVGGLFGRSLGRLMSVDPGFDPGNIATIAYEMPTNRPSGVGEITRFHGEVRRAVEAIPEVRQVSMTNELPFPGGNYSNAFRLERGGNRIWSTMWNRSVLSNYHEVLGIPLLSGRLLSPIDGPGDPAVIVVSRSLAERSWPGETALGKTLWQGGDGGPEWTVVGVVGDVRHKTLGAPAEPTLYRSVRQTPPERQYLVRRLYVVARTTDDPAAVLPAMRRAIWGVDPNTPIADTGVMTELMRNSEADDRFRAVLLSCFGAMAIVLAAVGTFGVSARAVSARAREMGIRTALGARPSTLIRLVLREGLATGLIGVVVGMIAAGWASGLVAHFLYGIETTDPVTYGSVCVLTISVCLTAAYIPARRAAMVDPVSIIAPD